jgi:hypothetical protein
MNEASSKVSAVSTFSPARGIPQLGSRALWS